MAKIANSACWQTRLLMEEVRKMVKAGPDALKPLPGSLKMRRIGRRRRSGVLCACSSCSLLPLPFRLLQPLSHLLVVLSV